MGAALFDRFADWTADADDVLGYSIRELCVDDPRGELGLTQFTQPALFVVNAMTYRARQEDGGAPPDVRRRPQPRRIQRAAGGRRVRLRDGPRAWSSAAARSWGR